MLLASARRALIRYSSVKCSTVQCTSVQQHIIGKCWIVVACVWMIGCSSVTPVGSYPENSYPVNQGGVAAETGWLAVDNLIVKGDQQRRTGQLAMASATLERALRLAPRSPDVYVALARVKLDAGQYASAKQFAHKALSLFPAKTTWKQERAKTEAQWVIKEATNNINKNHQ